MASDRPSVLFICRRNSGKSQMAAGLMRKHAGEHIDAHSAGTEPGESINQLSAESLLEVGVNITGEHPKPIDSELLRSVNRVVILGREAQLPAAEGVNVEYWDTDEPSQRGIDGIERMRLIRDDITDRVRQLASDIAR
ncbi:low molecular weight phosphatase family protein [Mycobacteroides chelonae]|uniref:Low molecular weight phosphatase family protein n=2 Tax=Mycobacteroides chelonae TaxID=1774 RepID=A0AB73TYL7_MYCCH|nr:low molecular weight phosphatase family protein [Mycobacteroides chelonae]MBF9317155.1 low molecular weight phosphatase family protein [Mycobacteroides chelonae]QDF69636.1 low molecular weight phosphatase family protein [Mycobacteroides chelonae]